MGKMQKLVKTLMKAGKSRDRAVLIVAKSFGLSMTAMELLHYSVKG